MNEAGVQGVMRPLDTQTLGSESPAQDKTLGESSAAIGNTSTEQNRQAYLDQPLGNITI